jgi:hypothetical protein
MRNSRQDEGCSRIIKNSILGNILGKTVGSKWLRSPWGRRAMEGLEQG